MDNSFKTTMMGREAIVKIGGFFIIGNCIKKVAISEETDFDTKTIRKYIQHDELPSNKKVEKKPSKLDPYKPYVLQRIK